MKNNFLILMLSLLPAMGYASADTSSSAETGGLSTEPFIIANKTKALLYYQYAQNMTGKIGSMTFANSKSQGGGTLKSGELVQVGPQIRIGNMPDVWSKEIDLRLSIDPKVKWFAAMVAPAGYLITQDPNNEQQLKLIKLIKAAAGQYSTPEGEEGSIPLSESTALYQPR